MTTKTARVRRAKDAKYFMINDSVKGRKNYFNLILFLLKI
jgi:hypothetical protein